MASLTLEINGELRTVNSASNILELLGVLGIGVERVAVELNRTIVRRKDWGSTPLAENDRVEIVRFVGGG
jgi:thiamine biosynthesis protein ThiS